MKSLLRLIFVLIVLSPVFSSALNTKILVDGYVTDMVTGNPVSGHPISIRYRNPELVFIYFDQTRTNEYGYFSFLVVVPATEGILQLSTVDCDNQIICQSLPFHHATTELHTSFTICQNQTMNLCVSDFLFVEIPQQPGKYFFKQAALGEIGSWFWDFGDGGTSTVPDPIHYFEQDGHYNVCLTVTTADGGCTDTYCAYIDSMDDTLLVARYTYYPLPGQERTYQFVDLSSGNISEWIWDFGDGRTVSTRHPQHTFKDYGTYNVCLTVKKTSNVQQTLCRQVIIEDVTPCNLSFQSFTDPLSSRTIHFIDHSFEGADEWIWDFGDGNTSSQQKPVHTYSEQGIYTVTLQASSQTGGCSSVFSRTISIHNTPHTEIMFRYATHPENQLMCQFFSISDGNPDYWHWDFGDGSFSTLENPVHVFPAEGIYQVCLTAGYSNSSQNSTYCQTVQLLSTSTCTAFYRYRHEISDPLTIHFTNVSVGNPVNFHWDFGDGHVSFSENPTHTYSAAGFYRVTLTVSDTLNSCSGSWTELVPAGHIPPLQPDFTAFPFEPLQTTLQFFDISSGTFDIKIWSFGDGSFSSQSHPVHTYQQPGVYQVCLHLEDSRTRIAKQIWKSVYAGIPITCDARFLILPSVHHPLYFRMVDQSKGYQLNYNWNFGNSITSSMKNPVVSYQEEGNYQVCLTISEGLPGLCTDQVCDTLLIEIEKKCEADFGFVLPQSQNLKVEFHDLSTGIMNSWLWDFGDGNFSTLQHPVHFYADSGLYLVKLKVFHTDSLLWCSSEKALSIPVYAPPPTCYVDFTAYPDSGINAPYKFHFRNYSNGFNAQWFWDFGDGHYSNLREPVHQFTHQGPYEVELTMSIGNPYGQGCIGSKKISFQSPEYYHIGGLIYGGLFPLNNPYPAGDTAEVFFYRVRQNKIIPLDTSRFTQYGYYYALYLLEGDYLIKAQLTRNSSRFSEFFPTYLGNQLLWENASYCHLADSNNYHLHIHLKPVPDIPAGIGSISGRVYFTQPKQMTPAINTVVLLFSEQMSPLDFFLTDQNGMFSFHNLTLGTYYIAAESAGKIFSPELITLTEQQPELKDLELFLMDSGPSGNGGLPVPPQKIQIFPNPFADLIRISIHSEYSQWINIHLSDVCGRVLLKKPGVLLKPGDNQIVLSGSDLPKGIYVLILEGKNFSRKAFKLIK